MSAIAKNNVFYGAVEPLPINDGSTSATETWSGQYLNQEITAINSNLATKDIDGWKVTELPNGFKLCFKSFDVSITAFSAWGQIYESNALLENVSFPISFSTVGSVQAKIPNINDMGYEMNYSSSKLNTVRVLRPTQLTGLPLNSVIRIVVIGI